MKRKTKTSRWESPLVGFASHPRRVFESQATSPWPMPDNLAIPDIDSALHKYAKAKFFAAIELIKFLLVLAIAY